MKKVIACLVSILLFAIPLASAHARAASSISFGVSKAANNQDLLVYARLLSTVTESYINMNVTLQRYVGNKWEPYKYYNSYVKNTDICILSETENAPKGYYYRLALSFTSTSIPGSGLYYSDSYYW